VSIHKVPIYGLQMSVSCASVAQVLFCTFHYGSRKSAIFVTYLGLSGWTLREKITAYKAEGLEIIYIDESGFANDMPRTHGYARVGQRMLWDARLALKRKNERDRCLAEPLFV
jgi:hypothetical protein